MILFKEIFSISMVIYVVKIIYTNWEKLGPNILGLSLSPEKIAIYSFALMFAKKIMSISDAVTDVNLPILSEKFIDNMISQQLFVINMNIEDVDILSIIDRIEISKTRIEIFFKNLPITSCFVDSKDGKLHYDTLNS